MAELISPQKKLTPQEMSDFESIFSVSIPDSFKDHYLKINGGFVSESDVEAELWGLPVNGFNPIKHGKLTIERLIEDIHEIKPNNGQNGVWGYKQFVPFSYDLGGNIIFISLKYDDWGEVHLYAPDGGNIINIDSSFTSFLRRLYKMD
ncbi:SMI1/KNR4 family protein [Pectobacterium parmentieri]|uniref:SMI1/KNR4 family protein n=1 Tax=Pectobacterium parmentieri TaxID=1905730 RepID=A0A8B3FDK6_PECPM|nr:SMI1/KNR4 family protein [Pectobacterium parmentieri]ACX90012.1 Cell wall assembly/cell proliferation coordinating protein, KNR4-like protein [Pectobacterium parmentieri WPP163]AOR61128.1 cell wall assembly/cell proliferation coordinating protein [Pectobacterium parmentieri]AYH03393.1 SMI1/KNR4 family protein [Pectobacterium parmentieri]AYH07727.1 SMI1/KNR4 family protein [Pectobacterium parmentieri]AYH12204.1 SMI1/KNR4 family protein [Pectobacterium parmentieri]